MATLWLHHLPESSPKCNDGTTPAYWLRQVQGAEVVLIWLQGGGDCATKDSCDQRTSGLKSSADLKESKYLDGIFSDSESLNPFFARSTRVFVHYCSSDSWIGRRSGEMHGYLFQGSKILSAVLHSLEMMLSGAKLVVIGGCSAGGRGAFYNLDRLCDMLPNSSTMCRGVLDAAWWVPDAGPLELQSAQGMKLWNADMGSCAQQQGNASHLCLFGPIWAPHVRTPYLVHEEQFDHFLLGKRDVHRPLVTWSSSAWNKAAQLREEMQQSFLRTTLPGASVTFSGACADHCFAQSTAYWTVKVKGVSMESLTRQWLTDTATVTSSVIETCDQPNCSSGCPFEPLLHEVILVVLAALFCLCICCCCCCRYWRRGSGRPTPSGVSRARSGEWRVIGAGAEDESKESSEGGT
eukprot:symbB.v1.2.008055.t1/scaffold502.1/size262339/9